MAQKTIDEKITDYENKIERIENKLEKQEGFQSLEGAGGEGARTVFTKSLDLEKTLEKYNALLSQARLRKTQGYSV